MNIFLYLSVSLFTISEAIFVTVPQCDCLSQCDVDRGPDAVQGCLHIRCQFEGSIASFRQACDKQRLVRRENPVPSSFSDGVTLGTSGMQTKEAIQKLAKMKAPALKPCTTLQSCNPVPNIVHFMFKTDITKMRYLPNPVWREALLGWRRHFNADQWQYMFWDEDAIDKQFKRHCSGHIKLFESFKSNISRADLARYCILHELGGIYSDLDYEPRSNFGNDLAPGKVNLIQSPYKYETFQNSLMASPPGHAFWSDLLDLAHEFGSLTDPTAATGPRLVDALSIIHHKNNVTSIRPDVNILPCQQFQLKTHSDDNTGKPQCPMLSNSNVADVKGIHWGTWSWYNIGQGKVYNKEIEDLFLDLHRGEVTWQVPTDGKPKPVKSHEKLSNNLKKEIDPAAFAPSAKNILDLKE
jgi:mannosyltransferase OCH1-like enzyme